MTRRKYQKKAEQQETNAPKAQPTNEKTITMRTAPALRSASGVLSFHNVEAQKTFKNLLNMVEKN